MLELKIFVQYNGQSLKIKTVNKTKDTKTLRCTYCMCVCRCVCMCVCFSSVVQRMYSIICETH